MTGKEKLRAALNHEAGPVPVDFGSNAVTGMHVSVVAELREYYGLPKEPVKIIEPYQMLGEIDDNLKSIIGVDVDGLYPYGTIFGFPNENWKEWRTPWGQTVQVPGRFEVRKSNGDTYIYPQGDLSADPSGRMPSSGFFFDSIIRQNDIDEDNLDASDNLEEFVPITTAELDCFRLQAEAVTLNKRGLCANFGGTGLGDIALVPGPFLKSPKGIRDITEWYISTVARKDYLHEIFSVQTDQALENLSKIKDAVNDYVDAMFLCGTDFGTQTSSFCSIPTFNELYMPYYRKMTDWIHENTKWKVFKHSCGAIENFMESFIDAGFDIINPVQCSATGMDPEKLKAKYGDRIVFWGGGIDTQRVLPFGSPDEVRNQVLERLRIFSGNGGFVFNSIHNVQAKTPIENIIAMIDAVREFNERG
jgi:hypothetical protein